MVTQRHCQAHCLQRGAPGGHPAASTLPSAWMRPTNPQPSAGDLHGTRVMNLLIHIYHCGDIPSSEPQLLLLLAPAGTPLSPPFLREGSSSSKHNPFVFSTLWGAFGCDFWTCPSARGDTAPAKQGHTAPRAGKRHQRLGLGSSSLPATGGCCWHEASSCDSCVPRAWR